METQGKRYAAIRARSGLSQQEFAESLGISQPQASLIEADRRDAGRDVLQRLASVYRVNLNWYLTGSDESTPFAGETGSTVTIAHILQEAAAGSGTDIDDTAEVRTITVPRSLVAGYNPDRLRAVTVRGDSMIEKEIFDRDIVIYNPQDTDGDSVSVIFVSGQLLVKHVVPDPITATLTLISANKVYPPRLIAGEELSRVKIEGRVVACLHRM